MAMSTSKMQKLSFQWNIKDVDNCDLVSDEFFDSTQFSITDSTFKSNWKLRMYPAGTKAKKIRNNPTFLLLRIDSGPILYTKYSISLLNRNGSRFHTKNCLELCATEYTDSHDIEITKDLRNFLDGRVLSVLCDIEIYDQNDGIQVAIQEKHIQILATSLVIKSMHRSTNIALTTGKITSFYLPYGKLSLSFEGTITYASHSSVYRICFKIFDENYPEIKEVPITLCNGNKSTYNIKRSSTETFTIGSSAALVEISTRCMIESLSNASAIILAPYVRNVQADYRNMFVKPNFGDISIIVGEKILRAHEDILSSRCPVFAAMFNHEWREKTTRSLTIRDFDYKTILALMEYIYCGRDDEDCDESAADPAELLKAAHMYQLDDLKSKCELRLCKSLEKAKVSSFLTLAETYDLPSLKTATFHFMTHNKIMH